MVKKTKTTYSTNEVCAKLDITKNTLFNWEKEGKIDKVKKDWRGWRIFSENNVEEIKKIISDKQRKHS